MPEALTDILTHILPVVDDGPETMEESVDMALEAFQKGTDRIVATPHQRDIVLNNNLEDARRYLAELNSMIIKRSLPKSPKRILLGMENHMSGELPEQIENGQAITLNNSRFILISLPLSSFPNYIYDVLTSLRLMHLVPILARPERNRVLVKNPKIMIELADNGTLFIMASGSVTGEFGKRTQRDALKLTKNNLIHVIGSDMHSAKTKRSPTLYQAFKWIKRFNGQEIASDLFIKNPTMILSGHSPLD